MRSNQAMERTRKAFGSRLAGTFGFFVLLGMCSLSGALAQLSPLEGKIIGTWQFAGGTGRIVLRADHACTTMLPIAGGGGWEIIARGRWRIEGDFLIRVEKPASNRSVSNEVPGLSVTSKLRIRSIEPDTFRLGDGRAMRRVK